MEWVFLVGMAAVAIFCLIKLEEREEKRGLNKYYIYYKDS